MLLSNVFVGEVTDLAGDRLDWRVGDHAVARTLSASVKELCEAHANERDLQLRCDVWLKRSHGEAPIFAPHAQPGYVSTLYPQDLVEDRSMYQHREQVWHGEWVQSVGSVTRIGHDDVIGDILWLVSEVVDPLVSTHVPVELQVHLQMAGYEDRYTLPEVGGPELPLMKTGDGLTSFHTLALTDGVAAGENV